MIPPTRLKLRQIARERKIQYRALTDKDPLVVRTRMSRDIPVPRAKAFHAFADPMSHVPLFSIIKGSTPPIRRGIDRILPPNQFFAFEHVEEGDLPPRLMLVKYTLNEPREIIKEAVTDPFAEEGVIPLDRKRGIVKMLFTHVSPNKSRLTVESRFQAATGAIFAREFIDLVWLNFFERMMVAEGGIADNEMHTKEFFTS